MGAGVRFIFDVVAYTSQDAEWLPCNDIDSAHFSAILLKQLITPLLKF